MTLRGLLWAFGAAEQDEAGQVAINSPATIEAVKLMATIYRESMTSDVFMWDPSPTTASSCGAAPRSSRTRSPPSGAWRRQPGARPEGGARAPAAGPARAPGRRTVLHCYVVWKFSDKAELAKRFLVDLVAAAEEAFRASEFYNLPCFPRAVPDLAKKLGRREGRPGPEAAAPRSPADRYALLADADRWSASPGLSRATSRRPSTRRCSAGSSPRCSRARRAGEQSAEASVRTAEVEMRRIFARWSR